MFYGEIAQLARAIGSYPIGQEFESLSRYHINITNRNVSFLIYNFKKEAYTYEICCKRKIIVI